jgi:hypothetical protein
LEKKRNAGVLRLRHGTSDGRHAVTYRVAALALVAFAIHFAWEMGHARWFATMNGLPFWTATAWCARAALWDVAINAFAFVVAALAVRSWRWPRALQLLPVATYLAAGLAVTIAIEWWAVSTGRWRYAAGMATIAGVGVSPLLQWIVVPLVLVAVARVIARSSQSLR